MTVSILVIDDEFSIRDSLQIYLSRAGYKVTTAETAKAGLEKLSAEEFHLLITDLRLPDMDGIKVINESKKINPDIHCIMITAFGTVETAIDAMRHGAFDYIQKPFKLEELEVRINRALNERERAREVEYLRTRVKDDQLAESVLCKSPVMAQLYELVKRVSKTDSICLISGESGVGKEVVARMIHELSPRFREPMLCVNCAALSAGLLESELFGHEKGAFTGADQLRRGRFELADKGTLMLDEVSEINLNLQAKLLRVLQEKSFERVGSSQLRKSDVRVIATTNRDLAKEVQKGSFRQDLFYRLNVVPIKVPPLRDHIDDVPDMVKSFINKSRFKAKKFSDSAVKMILKYSWPGNIRELKNVVERALILSASDTVAAEIIEPWLESQALITRGSEYLSSFVGVPLEEIESQLIELNLKHFGGNKQKTADALGITSRTLHNKLKGKTNVSGK